MILNTSRKNFRAFGALFFSFGEASVLFLFVLLVISWLTRSPQFIPGWEVWFPKGYVTDATPAILISFLFFIWPSRLFDFEPGVRNVPTILTWKSMKRKFPWDVFLLLGGAIALADGTQVRRFLFYLSIAVIRMIKKFSFLEAFL